MGQAPVPRSLYMKFTPGTRCSDPSIDNHYNNISFAVAPGDYSAVSTLLMFDSCDTRQCISISVNGGGLESMFFLVTLGRTSDLDSRITLDPAVGQIDITANNGTVNF